MNAYALLTCIVVILALSPVGVYGQACDSTLRSVTGVIQSPGYPSNYPDSLRCSWRIESSPNMVIELNIETFDLESGPSCTYDSLTVYDGIESFSTVMLLQPSCGTSIPWPAHPTTLLSSGSVMTLTFLSDSSVSSSGFRATYKQVAPYEESIFAVDAENLIIYKQNRFGDNFATVPFFGLLTPVAIDYDPVDEKIYITDPWTERIGRVNLDGSGQETIIASLMVSEPEGLAVDPVYRVVYWTDVGTASYPTVTVARLDGSFRRILVETDIESPRDIVVQPNQGYVYWSDWGSVAKIERMNGDGTGRTVLVDSGLGWPNGIAIDTVGRKLYWADALLNKIERSNLDGFLREVIREFDDDIHPIGLIYHDNALFWTDWISEGIDVADSDIQAEPSTLHVAGVPTRFHGLAFHSTADPPIIVNDCSFQSQIGGCEELCLSVPSGTSCVAVSPIFQNCPNDMFISTRVVTTVTWTDPTVYSPSGVPVTVTSSHPSSSLNVSPNDGTIQVTYSAVDQIGNWRECSFNIVVTFDEYPPPVVIGCPEDIIKEVSTKDDFIYVSWEEPRAKSEIGEVTLRSQSHSRGLFPVGSTPVTYVWEDRVGKSSECNFLVTVNVVDDDMGDSSSVLFYGLGGGGAFILCFVLIIIVAVICKCTTCSCKRTNVRDENSVPPPYAPPSAPSASKVWSKPDQAPPPKNETPYYLELEGNNYYSHGIQSSARKDEPMQRPPPLPPGRNDS